MKNKKTIISAVLVVAALLAAKTFGIGNGGETNDNIASQNNAIVSQTEQNISEENTDESSENVAEEPGTEKTVAEETIEEETTAEETAVAESENEIKTEAAETQAVEIVYKFRNKSLWKEHFEKHGSEFPYDTKEDYLEGANIMMANPNKLHKTEKEDGDDVYYLEETNEFIIISGDGYLRTYFKPSRGKAYFDSQ